MGALINFVDMKHRLFQAMAFLAGALAFGAILTINFVASIPGRFVRKESKAPSWADNIWAIQDQAAAASVERPMVNTPGGNLPDNSWCGVKSGDDYNQLVSCLRSNFRSAFSGTGYPDRDPQDMIQFMAAKIMEYRRRLGDIT